MTSTVASKEVPPYSSPAAAASAASQSLRSHEKPMKLLLFGTHPQQSNGYAKVVYELLRQMSWMHAAVRVFVFGFQNVLGDARMRTDVPDNVVIYDALAEESPKQQGFGFDLVQNYVRLCDPDVVVIFNDMYVISRILLELRQIPERRFKIVTYIDQVYLSQKTQYIQLVNSVADFAFAFSPNWQRCIEAQGLAVPTDFVPHGINPDMYFPIPRHLLSLYYGQSDDDFLILNLNRNQPRKRWDVCMKAFAEVLRRHRGAPIKLLVATALKGAWTIPDVYAKELHKHGIPAAEGLKHLVFVDTPQRMSDREVNMLYNLCDVGINTCDGEGFGLCNVEHAITGKPQVVPRLGSFPDVFDDDSATLIDHKVEVYLDNSREILEGEALLCSHLDFADALCKYYEDPELRRRHGANARARILDRYRWEDVGKKFVRLCRKVGGFPELVTDEDLARGGDRGIASSDVAAAEEEEDTEYESMDFAVDEVASRVQKMRLRKYPVTHDFDAVRRELDHLQQEVDGLRRAVSQRPSSSASPCPST